MQHGPLRTSCKALDIRLRSFLSQPGTSSPQLKDPIRSLGTLTAIRNKYKTCLLCRLIFAVFRSEPLRRIKSISNLSDVVVFARWINGLGPSKAERSRISSLCILVWAESPRIPRDRYKIILRAVSDLFPAQPHFGRLSLVQNPTLDYEQLKTWLHHCEVKHELCGCTSGTSPTRHFFVVDVLKRCIVTPPEPCRYVALSYVWGGVSQHMLTEDNSDELQAEGGIKEKHLAPTIRDAMVLTARLGERYLWCDALCIIQDSKSIRQQTLQDMGTIYAQSLFTIVAGSCTSANDNLPGVTTERHWLQWFQKISAGLTLSAHFDFKDYLENSMYNCRAWTFQEYQLANSLLVFAPNGQIYLSCREAVYSEEVVTGIALGPDAPMQHGAEMIKVRPDSRRLWSSYRDAVELYTSRRLTNEDDIIDAFSGLLQALHSGRCIEGIPKAVLNIALLWQPYEKLHRRLGFSSWSWAGWKGRVRWVDALVFDDVEAHVTDERTEIEKWTHNNTWIVWHSSSVKTCRSPAFIADGPPWLIGSNSDPILQDKRFPGLTRTSRITPTLMLDRVKEHSGASHDQRYLQFWTVSVHLRIELERTAVLRYTSLQPENTGNGLRRFLTHDEERPCGWILLDETWIERFTFGDTDMQEFVLLSEATTKENMHMQHDAVGSSKGRSYNAMMITWYDGIAERAGLGQVSIDSLLLEKLKWKEVLLG